MRRWPTRIAELSVALGAAGALAVTACGGAPPPQPVSTMAPGPGQPADRPADVANPSLLVPQLKRGALSVVASERGSEHFIEGGLRMSLDAAGRVSRGNQRFPSGAVHTTKLPEHLGGGFLFHQSDSQGTRLWRSDSWTGELRPLSHVNSITKEVIPGFERLYLRSRQNGLMAVSLEDGSVMDMGTLPASSAYGAMVFADGWRALVDTDLRGTLATFDAGATWVRVPLDGAPYAAGLREGDPALYLNGGGYRLDANGSLQPLGSLATAAADESATPTPAPAHPLGREPLRTAVEHGQLTEDGTVVVAYRGALVRVSLPDATVLGDQPGALEQEHASCSPTRIGDGFGFICGAEQGSTIIYRYQAPLGARVVARFSGPRFVSPSGNGALVVRGSCRSEDDAGGSGQGQGLLSYCILRADGSHHEIAVKGEIGAERVVALRDGRTVVLVPPRLSRPGQLTLIAGSKVTSHELSYPEGPKRTVELARAGLWMQGFQQRTANSIGGWVEAGGPAVGVEVALDGKVTVGKLYDEGGELLVAGRLALAVNDTEGARESTDGGKTWSPIELPQLPNALDGNTRGCSAVGCSLRGWVRLGWGPSGDSADLTTAAAPRPVSHAGRLPLTAQLHCKIVAEPEAAKERERVGTRAPYSSWIPFRDSQPPALSEAMLGVDKGTASYDHVPAHVYVWGPKNANWTRTGWWNIRVDDRFGSPGVISSAPTRPPWSDDATAADAIGARRHGSYWSWNAVLDPAGDAALVSVCTGPICLPYGVVDGRPIQPLRMGNTVQLPRPRGGGIVRLGETWYFLGEIPREGDLTLYRAELGNLQRVSTIRRLDSNHFSAGPTPTLVSRAGSDGLGLLVTLPPNAAAGERVGRWQVLPLDPTSGEVDEPIDLGLAQLTEAHERCTPNDDGWRADVRTTLSPNVLFDDAHGYVEDLELRVRLDPGNRCVEAIAGISGRTLRRRAAAAPTLPWRPAAPAPKVVDDGIPLIARDRYNGQRWRFSCK